MKKDTIDFELPAEGPGSLPRDFHMSPELFQNACLTMGELRDLMRESGLSWDCLEAQIERARHTPSPLDRAIGAMDEYSTGLGKSLHDKNPNIW